MTGKRRHIMTSLAFFCVYRTGTSFVVRPKHRRLFFYPLWQFWQHLSQCAVLITIQCHNAHNNAASTVDRNLSLHATSFTITDCHFAVCVQIKQIKKAMVLVGVFLNFGQSLAGCCFQSLCYAKLFGS